MTRRSYLLHAILFLALFLTAAGPYRRIVSLKPNITAILISLDLGDDVVGITKFCAQPNSQVKIIADYTSIDLEALLGLKPDLVLGSSENSQGRQYEALSAQALNLKLFDFYDFDSMQDSFLKIAEILHRSDQAHAVVTQMGTTLNQLKQKIPAGKTFIVIVQHKPIMVASGRTYISSLLTRIGLKNYFKDNRVAYPVLDDEALYLAKPDYVFDLTHDGSAGDLNLAGKKIMRLNIRDFLAAPGSVQALADLINRL